MTIAAKAAVALGVGGVAVVGCYVTGVFGGEVANTVTSTPGDIPWSSLFSNANFTQTYNSANTVGKEYGQYLTDTGEANKTWWEEAYKKYEEGKSDESSLHEIFMNGKIDSAYSVNGNTKALNKVCAAAYNKSLTNDVDFEATDTEDKRKLANNILKYCSIIEKVPEIISTETSYTDNTIGKQGNTKKLIIATNSTNDGFWKAQQEWFKEQGKNSNSLDAYFEQFFEGEDSQKTLKADKNIKDICNEAYGKPAATGTSSSAEPTADDVAKYCSFKKLTS